MAKLIACEASWCLSVLWQTKERYAHTIGSKLFRIFASDKASSASLYSCNCTNEWGNDEQIKN